MSNYKDFTPVKNVSKDGKIYMTIEENGGPIVSGYNEADTKKKLKEGFVGFLLVSDMQSLEQNEQLEDFNRDETIEVFNNKVNRL